MRAKAGGGASAVIAALDAAASHPPQKMDGWNSGWVLLTLQNTFYRLLHAESFEEALVETIACGGGDAGLFRSTEARSNSTPYFNLQTAGNWARQCCR